MRKQTKTDAARSVPLSAARLAAVQALYQMDVAQTDAADVVQQFCEHRLSPQSGDDGCRGADAALFGRIVKGVVAEQRQIDPLLNAKLAEGWRLPRIDSILRAILRAAIYELLQSPEVPAKVVINEYVDVAHAFFEEEEPKFVNAIVDGLAREIRSLEFDGTADG